VADMEKTCANCGHKQTSGDFCEACGTRLPVAQPAETAAAAGYGAAGGVGTTGTPPPSSPPPRASTPPPYTGGSQYGGPPPMAPPPGASPRYSEGRGFWSRFFDFSFHEFITPSLIKVLFILAVVVIGLGVLVSIIMGFVTSGVYGIFFLIAALIAGFIYLLLARVGLEMVIIFFRIHDQTREIAESKKK